MMGRDDVRRGDGRKEEQHPWAVHEASAPAMCNFPNLHLHLHFAVPYLYNSSDSTARSWIVVGKKTKAWTTSIPA